MDTEFLNQVRVKVNGEIAQECAKAALEIEHYATMATGHPYASPEDIERAVEAGRAMTDAITKLKSEAMIEADNLLKDANTNAV